jgi:hypothetical protein
MMSLLKKIFRRDVKKNKEYIKENAPYLYLKEDINNDDYEKMPVKEKLNTGKRKIKRRKI